MKLFSKFMNLFSKSDASSSEKDDSSKKTSGKKSKKRFAVIALILVIAIVAGCFFAYGKLFGENQNAGGFITARAAIGGVQSVIEGSGVIEAIEQYDITSLKKGEITADFFKEGDTVSEDSVLYQMDDEEGHNAVDSAKTNLDNAEDAVESAEASVNKAQKNLDNAKKDVNNLSVKSENSGIITNMYISVGDSVNANSKIADVIDVSTMVLEIQFLADFSAGLYVGAPAEVTLSNVGTVVGGTVSRVSSGYVISSVGSKVCNVEITVNNPGSVENGDYATATVGEYACSSEGVFRYSSEGTIYSEVSGKVKKLNCIKGDRISAGEVVAVLENSSLNDAVDNAEDALSDARRNLELKKKSLNDARERYNEALEALEDYTVTAPISGKIIQKNIKAGENLEGSSNSTSSMATIADLSSLVFSMNVDELDVLSVENGMEVEITADAIENVTFAGKVTNVSIMGTSSNGVTTYPVEVTFSPKEEQPAIANARYDELIPGLNVSARIVIEKAENVLVIPVSAVRRGNIVIIKDDSKSEGIPLEEAGGSFGGRNNTVIPTPSDREEPVGSDAERFSGKDDAFPSDGHRLPDGDKGIESDSENGNKASGRKNGGNNFDIPENKPDESFASPDEKSENNSDSKANDRLKSMLESLDIPDGYKAIFVETGLSDENFIEIKRGLSEGDIVLLPDTTQSSANSQMQGGMPGAMGGGMPGAMPGGMGGGMPGGMGGNRSGQNNRGGMGNMR